MEHPGNAQEGPSRMEGFNDVEVTEVDKEAAQKAINDLYNNNKLNIRKVMGMCKSKSRIAESQLSKGTLDAIIASVSLSLKAADSQDFAIARPPGHHANLYVPKGFCIINNIAVVVHKLVTQGHKVCIIDIDGHHGNGTQDIFIKNPNVLYCSLHQENSYPNTGGLKDKAVGEETVNYPIPPGSGDDIFEVVTERILKRTQEFSPDIIAVSAGFDGHKDDPLLDLNFTDHSYYFFGKSLANLNIPTFSVLEGGYHNKLRNCVDSFISGFNGEKYNFQDEKTDSPQLISAIINKFI